MLSALAPRSDMRSGPDAKPTRYREADTDLMHYGSRTTTIWNAPELHR